MIARRLVVTAAACGLLIVGLAAELFAAAPARPILVGWATADITPPQPVNLVGQMSKRISQSVRDPLTATVLALETKGDDGGKEQAIMVSCDLAGIWHETQESLRELVKPKLADFDVDKLFMNATHTHTAPGTEEKFGTRYDVSGDPGVMTVTQYRPIFLERVAAAVVEAWQARKPAGVSWGLGHAVVGHNRRATYFDGKSVMYGSTAEPNFNTIEGYEDHGVELLFFFDADAKLTGMVINVACPSQETEGASYVSADFWHEVRQEIKKRYGADVFVFAQCAAAGDQSPHLLVRKAAEDRMVARKGIDRRQEIALRIANAVDEAYPWAAKEIQSQVIFQHAVVRADLPLLDPPSQPFYETDPVTPAEWHVLRLGDVALATNPFELYLDYGIRMKTRSPAIMTMLVQLSCGSSGYLPTARGVQGGGYSADHFLVSPEGGQALVEETVKQINQMWE